MQPHPSTVIAAAVAVLSLMVVADGQAKVHGTPLAAHDSGPRIEVLPLPDAPPDVPTAGLTGLADRMRQAAATAGTNGATISMVVHDRISGQTASAGSDASLPIASVAKLFIADDLLLQVANAQSTLSPDDQQALDGMLRSSDDNAAETFWGRNGGQAIVSRVAARYGLASLAVPYDGHWWNTTITPYDLVRYYNMLLDGSGGLPPEKAAIMLNDLALSTPQGMDGYPQRFGIPDGLYADQVAVKQGWMCCWNGGNWMHLSTGVVGADHRFIVVVGSMQPTDDATARNTVTQVVKTVFPDGHID
jgi:hypothetical protein